MTLRLYSHPISPCCQKVKFLLLEKKIKFEEVFIDLGAKQNLSNTYLKINPSGTVPTLQDNKKYIFESNVICEYLEEKFPTYSLMPSELYRRAKVRADLIFINEVVHKKSSAIIWPIVIRPKIIELSKDDQNNLINSVLDDERRQRQKRLLSKGLKSKDSSQAILFYKQLLETLENRLQDYPWLSGNKISLSDIGYAPYLQMLNLFGWLEIISDLPNLLRWLNRINKRSSFQQTFIHGIDLEIRNNAISQGMRNKKLVLDIVNGNRQLTF